MSTLEDRNDAREAEHVNLFGDAIDRWSDKEYFQGGPAYPNLGPAVAKHRRLDDTSYDGQKAYGQAVHAAIRALQRRELFSAAYDCASLPRDVGAMSDAQFMAMLRGNSRTFALTEDQLKTDSDFYRAMLKHRGVDPRRIADLQAGRDLSSYDRVLWLKATWNVIKGKRGTPYLVEAKAEPAPEPEAIEPAPQPKKRGRPFGSKNKPKLVAEPVKPAEQPKPSKPRVPSHYLSSASSVAYHAAM
jgi:hypothetical protein